jgi:hypothetical protein
MANLKNHGGSRPGSGRPKLENKKRVRTFALSPWAIDNIRKIARDRKISQSAALEILIHSSIENC